MAKEMPKFVVHEWPEFAIAMLKAAGIDPNSTRRMVIDLEVNCPGKFFVELYADRDAVYGVDLEPAVRAGITVERPARS